MSETNGMAMIEARGLSKLYGEFAAIRDVSFSVPRGQVAAFLGPNGAGKSTTLKVLTGYLSPSAGSAHIGGLDVASNRIEAVARIGYLPENGPLYPEMTPLELLEFFGSARGLEPDRMKRRIDEVVKQCHLEGVLEKSVFKLSKGYRQRVGMAQALLHEPDILIMDEPTSGLDPNQIRDVRQLIRALGETKTILISTHILQEVEAIADHVILVNEGRVVFDGTVDEMAAGGTLEEAFHRLTGKSAVTASAEPEATTPVEPEPTAQEVSYEPPQQAASTEPPSDSDGATESSTTKPNEEKPSTPSEGGAA